MSEERQRFRIHSHITKSSFLHAEDALEIGKIRIFAGHYKDGHAHAMTAHWVDVTDARVLFSDLAWGKSVDYIEFKGSRRDGEAVSRVLKIRTNDKVWFRLERGPGSFMGAGAVKPKGEPETVVNVPFTTREARKLAFAVLGFIQAWETTRLVMGPAIPAKWGPDTNHVPPEEGERAVIYDVQPDEF